MKQWRVALAHDFFVDYGGAERVVESLHALFPNAPVYTAFVDKKALGIQWKRFESWDIRQSWASKIPGIKQLYSPLRLFSAKFFSSFDLSSYDVVISSTNMYMAKAIKTKKPTLHICYCHTPPRSLYGYSTRMNWKKNPVIHAVGQIINHFMRIIDFNTAKNPDIFIANSKEVQRRISKFYRRDSIVIYPPIEIPEHPPTEKKQDFYLYVGRWAQSKHVDLAIQACTKLNKRLLVVGKGRSLAYLQSIAGDTVEFLGSIDDKQLHTLYETARCVIYPAEDEDFGMIAVEAMAHGTPVIVHKSGGFLESVIEKKTGIFFESFDVDAVVQAINQVEETEWNQQEIYTHSTQFSSAVFQKKIKDLIQSQLDSK